MEGFVKQKVGRTVEQVAQGYLNELANKNLILVARSKDDGSIKSFRIHDFLREMLLSKSRDQSFLMIVNEQTNECINKVRRLSIHGSWANFNPQRCVEYSYLPFDFVVGFKPPIGMGVLTSLYKLCFIEATPGIITELGKMKELRRLCILKLRREDGKDFCSSIGKLKNLQVLNISATAENEILDLDHLSSPPASLQRLYMSGRLENVPHWIKSLNNLVNVNFRWSQLRDDPLEYLQDLPNLVHLDLLMGYVGEELCFKARKFQRLKLLDLDKVEPLKQVIIEEGAMPNLEKIIIQRCTFLESVPSGIERLTNIQVLEFFDMPQEFVHKLLPDTLDGDYHKVAHIPQVYYTYWRDGAWEAHPLETKDEIGISSRPRTSIRCYDQRNSL
ncbi:Disease resistance protein RPM1 [Abeliophyllum distichum]|uniref:Disease resistance protein RPM1 n=1 Tax=Abeliophyllum distichum TaxID=126358 RepID=A0ABD1TG45_9LAMI